MIENSKRIVFKFGTNILRNEQGDISLSHLYSFIEDISYLYKQNKEILIVTSGAVGLGAKKLGIDTSTSTTLKQAAASVGQPMLMGIWQDGFEKYGITTAQILLTEEDFQPSEVVAVANKVVALERQLAELKAVEKRCKDMKQQLYEEMKKYNVKSWELYNGTKITRIDDAEAATETVVEFDVDKFASENPNAYLHYCRQVQKKKSGRAGYVRITLKE